MATAVIETPRLILREFSSDDGDFIHELLNTPGWLKYIGSRKIETTEDAVNYIESRIRKSYSETGFGFYLIVIKSSNAKAGMCGLVKRDSLDDIDIGFALLPRFENNGYAFEAAEGVLKYAKDKLKLFRVAAITATYNNSSIKLLEKLGMKFEKTIHLPGDTESLMLYYKELSN
ncbi:MAG: GNAT family N-acetyltransferase [Ignavibacteria bacterium]